MLQRGIPRDADLHCPSFSLLCPINELRGARWGSALDAGAQSRPSRMRDTSFVVSPIRDHAFLSSRSSSACSATTSFSAVDSRRSPLTFVGGGGAGRVARQAALAGFEELLRPHVIQALRNSFTAAQLGDAVLAAQVEQSRSGFCLPPRSPPGCPANVLHHLLRRLLGG